MEFHDFHHFNTLFRKKRSVLSLFSKKIKIWKAFYNGFGDFFKIMSFTMEYEGFDPQTASTNEQPLFRVPNLTYGGESAIWRHLFGVAFAMSCICTYGGKSAILHHISIAAFAISCIHTYGGKSAIWHHLFGVAFAISCIYT